MTQELFEELLDANLEARGVLTVLVSAHPEDVGLKEVIELQNMARQVLAEGLEVTGEAMMHLEEGQ